ncbi:hypothetical protein DFR58_111137 [Anaerobacterium chartisolvens]|uniref:Uncharacterized protein n=1 Tax=Anaerobacterium chartisolvens TaxID=1297424 RepID=A0A369B6Z5_9FIRM|nr:hypothetical protein [Anaerobacterium chartisolvens]RCX16388.1 hypothetical protein DFR58_111137 [Anaerobacterium chartisolvens]
MGKYAFKTVCLICCALFMLLNISGCAETPIDAAEKIVPPQNNLVPLEGRWVIMNHITEEPADMHKQSEEQWEGRIMEFTKDTLALDGLRWDGVSYKIKVVNTEEYFLYKYKGPIEGMGITSKDIHVITASSTDKFLYEFIKIDDNKFILNMDNEFFRLEKIMDKVEVLSQKRVPDTDERNLHVLIAQRQTSASGLLLGIRSAEPGSNSADAAFPPKYSYSTLWISWAYEKPGPILRADGIFLARKSGFWRVQVKENKSDDGNRVEDFIEAYSISKKDEEAAYEDSGDPFFWKYKEGTLRKSILYIGNDYISVKKIGAGKYKDSGKNWEQNKLVVLPVDNVSNREGIKISDVMGSEGRISVERAIDALPEDYMPRGLDLWTHEQSFALFRKTGHWFVKGRIDIDEGGSSRYFDYNINLIPPRELVAYDILHLSWTEIKDKIPEALDAFTSPNEDIAVIVTKNSIMLYKIDSGRLSEGPIKKVGLETGASVVMAEWSTGSYVSKWEKIFIRENDVKEMK